MIVITALCTECGAIVETDCNCGNDTVILYESTNEQVDDIIETYQEL